MKQLHGFFELSFAFKVHGTILRAKGGEGGGGEGRGGEGGREGVRGGGEGRE